jgi:toxin YhaV
LSKPQPVTRNGWTIFAHPLLLDQLETLMVQVETLRQKYPDTYQKKNSTKRLAAIVKLIVDVIPQDPTRKEYRQGNTLGEPYRHWFRAKFFQQYRLFFRFHQAHQLIVFAWVNDETCKRAYDSKTDAYQVFGKMLDSGKPPNT